jgi:hypothetical protein
MSGIQCHRRERLSRLRLATQIPRSHSGYLVSRGPTRGEPELDIETLEAEIVFLARCAGQWPEGQTEIHFHPSTEEHREIAANIWRYLTTPVLRERNWAKEIYG